MFKTLKTDCFQLWFLHKSDLGISTAGKHIGIPNQILLTLEKCYIFHIIDQILGTVVKRKLPSLFEGHLKLRLVSESVG